MRLSTQKCSHHVYRSESSGFDIPFNIRERLSGREQPFATKIALTGHVSILLFTLKRYCSKMTNQGFPTTVFLFQTLRMMKVRWISKERKK